MLAESPERMTGGPEPGICSTLNVHDHYYFVLGFWYFLLFIKFLFIIILCVNICLHICVYHVCAPCMYTMYVHCACAPCVCYVCAACVCTVYVHQVCAPIVCTMCMHHVYAPCMFLVLVENKRNHQIPETGVAGGCKSPCGC